MSGPVSGLVKTMLDHMAANSEFAVFISDRQRERILRGVFEQYYGDELAAEVIFDTSRSWCAQMPLLQQLFPGSKVIACVRETGWIVDSVERLVRRNVFSPSSIFNYQSGGTVYSRADGVAGPTGMLGYAYNALKEAFYGEYAQHLLLVQYETLVSKPQKALKAVYDFIGEPVFKHDFDNVAFDAEEFDRKAGTPGLHAVRSKVRAEPRKTILPPEIFNRFAKDAFWRNPQMNPHGVVIV